MQQIDYEESVSFVHDDKVFNAKAMVKKQGQTAEAVIDAKRTSTSPVNAYAKVSLEYPGRKVSIYHNIEEKKPNEYHNDFEAVCNEHKATANLQLTMKQRYEVVASANIPTLKPIEIEGHFKPDLFNMEAHASGKYGNRQYFTTAEWTAPKNLNRDFSVEHSIKFG